MRYVMPEKRTTYNGAAGTEAPVIYVIDLPEYSFDITGAVQGLSATVVKLPVRDWDDSLTPWSAPGLYHGDADFKGEASVTLTELVEEAIPSIEKEEQLSPSRRAICGYSLGGLFALYAFTRVSYFDALACLSGSVWYEGWVEYLRELDCDLQGKYAFFSIGSKEKKANPPILHCVEDNMAQCAEIVRAHGCEATFEIGPGTHTQHHEERFRRGLTALDAWLAQD